MDDGDAGLRGPVLGARLRRPAGGPDLIASAQARRTDRLTDQEHRTSLRLLNQLWSEIEVVVARAATLAHLLALRGYDAVRCASAEQLNDEDVVVASGDQRLLAAWTELGVATFDTLVTRG